MTAQRCVRVMQRCIAAAPQAQQASSRAGRHRRCTSPGMTLPRRPPRVPAPRPLGRRRHGFPRSHGPPERKVKAQWLRLRCCTDRVQATLRRPVPARPSERGRNAEQTQAPQESARSHDMLGAHAQQHPCQPRCGPIRCRADPCRPRNRRNPRAAGMLENSEIWRRERTCRLRCKGCSNDRRRRPNAAPPCRKNVSEKTEGTQEPWESWKSTHDIATAPTRGDGRSGRRGAIADAGASFPAFHGVRLETIKAQRIALCTRTWAPGPLRFSPWPGTTCGCPPATVAT
jgi:hypothetical protein